MDLLGSALNLVVSAFEAPPTCLREDVRHSRCLLLTIQEDFVIIESPDLASSWICSADDSPKPKRRIAFAQEERIFFDRQAPTAVALLGPKLDAAYTVVRGRPIPGR